MAIATLLAPPLKRLSAAIPATRNNLLYERRSYVKKRILLVALIIVGSFGGGLAINEYSQRATVVIHFTITAYNEDGTIYDSSKSVWVGNRRGRKGEWTETQIFPNGKLSSASGTWTPPDESLASYPDAPREEILGRTVVVFFDRRAEAWWDPSLHQCLKTILYTDETRQTVSDVIEAVEIND